MQVTITPDLDTFTELAHHNRVISVYARLLAPNLTPTAIYDILCGQRPQTFLFESMPSDASVRWSFIGVNSAATLTSRGQQATWAWQGRPIDGMPTDGTPLEVLGQTLQILQSEPGEGLPPLSSGMVGFLGYDVVRQFLDIPDHAIDDRHLPDFMMMVTTDLVAFNHLSGEIWVISNAINFNDSDEGVTDAWANAATRVRDMVGQLLQGEPVRLRPRPDPQLPVEYQRQRSSESFQDAVRACQRHIANQEISQIVISQRFEMHTDADAMDVYEELRSANPSPYLYLLRLEDQGQSFSLVGSSPESLITVRGGHVTTKPIGGTRPRGIDAASDTQLEQELLADPKEHAEHMMLIDVAVTDLNQVCVPETVSVAAIKQVRRFSHVMHLEGIVTGELKPNLTPLDAVLANFPAGTLTGSPRQRSIEILEELEETRRGPFGGVVGYFDFNGNADTAITIRTAIMSGQVAHIQAGAGVVSESIPQREDEETINKSYAVMQSIARAQWVTDQGKLTTEGAS